MSGMSCFIAPAPTWCLFCRAHPEQIRSDLREKSLSGVPGCAVITHLPLFGKRVWEIEGHLLSDCSNEASPL